MNNDSEYMSRVMRTLLNNPTSADIDFLIEAHTKIGYLASVAEGEADQAYAIRKNEEASAWKRIMNNAEEQGQKISNAAADRLAELEVYDLKMREVDTKTRATKIKNLLESIRECINGIKYIGRLGG